MKKLTAKWSKKERDIIFNFPASADGHYLCGVFTKEFLREMLDRGYDLTSLKFSIDRVPERSQWLIEKDEKYWVKDNEWTDNPRDAWLSEDQIKVDNQAHAVGGRRNNLFDVLREAGKIEKPGPYVP